MCMTVQKRTQSRTRSRGMRALSGEGPAKLFARSSRAIPLFQQRDIYRSPNERLFGPAWDAQISSGIDISDCLETARLLFDL